jgi:hypothetical protein
MPSWRLIAASVLLERQDSLDGMLAVLTAHGYNCSD